MAVGQPDISRRIVAHFPGFEPLDTHQHHARYRHSAAASASAFDIDVTVSGLDCESSVPTFTVRTNGDGWQTESSMYLFDHSDLVSSLKSASPLTRFREGYAAALSLIRDGTLFRYFGSSWRYALFFLFPFFAAPILAAIAFGLAALPVFLEIPPVHFLWSMTLAVLLARFALWPAAKRLHLFNLFDQWRLAVKLARMGQPELDKLVASHAIALKSVLSRMADDHLVTAHSLGGVFAVLALSRLLEKEPALFRGRIITFVTLAGSGLQVSLIKNALAFRAATRRVLECADIYWLDYQCLADPVHLYGSRVTREIARIDASFAGLEGPPVVTIRVKDMLHPRHYRRIRWDILRVHRQFVLGSDRPYRYDFLSLTAGPYASASFAAYNLASASRVTAPQDSSAANLPTETVQAQ